MFALVIASFHLAIGSKASARSADTRNQSASVFSARYCSEGMHPIVSLCEDISTCVHATLMLPSRFDREICTQEDNPTIGLILCTDKNDAVVEYVLDKGNGTYFRQSLQAGTSTQGRAAQTASGMALRETKRTSYEQGHYGSNCRPRRM